MNLSNNGKKLSDFLDEKMMEQSFTNSNSRKPCSLDPLGQGWIEKK